MLDYEALFQLILNKLLIFFHMYFCIILHASSAKVFIYCIQRPVVVKFITLHRAGIFSCIPFSIHLSKRSFLFKKLIVITQVSILCCEPVVGRVPSFWENWWEVQIELYIKWLCWTNLKHSWIQLNKFKCISEVGF